MLIMTPSCYGKKLGANACFNNCTFADRCYEVEIKPKGKQMTTKNDRKTLELIMVTIALILFCVLSAYSAQSATINPDGTFTVGETTWINDGNINYDSDDYSCLFNFGSPCSNASVGLTSYSFAVIVAEAACVGCRLPTVDEFLALYNDGVGFLNLVPDATYWALDQSGNPFLFGSPVVDLSTGTATRAEGLMGVMAISTVPLPAAVWLFGAGLIGLASVARKNNFNQERKER